MRHSKSERKNSKETNDDQAYCRNFLRRRVRNSDVRRKRRRSEKLLFRRRFNRSFGLYAVMGVSPTKVSDVFAATKDDFGDPPVRREAGRC